MSWRWSSFLLILQGRTETQAKEDRVKSQKQQNIAANTKCEADQNNHWYWKATVEAKEAKNAAEKAKAITTNKKGFWIGSS